MQIHHCNTYGKPIVSNCESYVIDYLNRHSEEYKVNDIVRSFGRLLNILGDKKIISERDIREVVSGDSAE